MNVPVAECEQCKQNCLNVINFQKKIVFRSNFIFKDIIHREILSACPFKKDQVIINVWEDKTPLASQCVQTLFDKDVVSRYIKTSTYFNLVAPIKDLLNKSIWEMPVPVMVQDEAFDKINYCFKNRDAILEISAKYDNGMERYGIIRNVSLDRTIVRLHSSK